jgi:putative molybdopterin biosynthesis protein
MSGIRYSSQRLDTACHDRRGNHMGRRTGAEHLENRIRELRERAGLSQGQLAAQAAITRQAVSAIESGGYVPNTVVALRLSQALGCSVEALFRISDISMKIQARASSTIGEWGGFDINNEQAGVNAGRHDGSRDFRVHLARVGDELIANEMSGPERFAPADGLGRTLPDEPGRLDVDLLVEREIPDRTVLVLGCDPSLRLLAEHVHRQTKQTRVLWRHAGSVAALRALRAGEAHIAGTHLWDPETGESNLPAIRRELAGMPVMVIALSEWQQGLMVRPGNPRGIRSMMDLARSDVTIVNREAGSGSRVLLDYHLSQAGIQPEWVTGYERMRRSHAEVATAVREGQADAGPGILASARAAGLDFIPLQEERYDLVVPVQFIDEQPVRALLDTLTERGYRREIETLGGYDSSLTGSVIEQLDAQ